MKKLPLILGILILADILFLAILNLGQTYNIVYLPNKTTFSIGALIFILSLAAYAALGTFLICYARIICLNSRLKKITRNVEKASIEAEGSSDKVKILQSKIDTLETALKEALKK